MLQVIGKHIHGWIAGVIIAIIALVFVLWGMEYYLDNPSGQQSAIATVNGTKITAKQLNSLYQAIQRNYNPQGAELSEQAQQQLRGMALQQLILNQVLIDSATKMHLVVTPQEVQQAVLQIPAFQVNGQFSPQRFQQLLANSGMTPDGFLQNLQTSLLVEQLSAGIQSSAFVLPNELEQIYSLLEQQRSFGYFILPAANFQTVAPPTEQQIQTYYENNKDQFKSPEQVKIAYLLLSPDSLRQEINVTPDEVKQFYQENSDQFAGKSFDAVKTNIEQRLFQQKLGQLLSAKSEQLADLTYTNPSSLEPAAKALGLTVKTSAWISRQGIKDDPILGNAKVLAATFSQDMLEGGSNSELIALNNGSYIVARVADRQSSQAQPIETARGAIQQRLHKEQMQKQAGLQAYQLQQALVTNGDKKLISQQYHTAWTEKHDITRRDKTVPAPIVEAAFNLTPDLASNKKPVTSILLPNGDYVIIQLDSWRNANYAQAPDAEKEKLRTGLAAREGELEFQLFSKSALDKAKIKNFSK